jgi:hypothetical protein
MEESPRKRHFLNAARRGALPLVQQLLSDGSASIRDADDDGMTALLLASRDGHLPTVVWLLEEGGAQISERNRHGSTAVMAGALNGRYATIEWLFIHGGASIDDKNESSQNVWTMLHVRPGKSDAARLTSLLKVMTLLEDAPALFTSRLSSLGPSYGQLCTLVKEGAGLRARLPAYLWDQRATLTAHCPLPAVLQSLIVAYAVPTRTDIWEYRLPIHARRPKRAREEA